MIRLTRAQSGDNQLIGKILCNIINRSRGDAIVV